MTPAAVPAIAAHGASQHARGVPVETIIRDAIARYQREMEKPMGEIADAMLDGTLCEGCGEYIGHGDTGIPQFCSAECARGRGADWFAPGEAIVPRAERKTKNVQCPHCPKKVRNYDGLKAHIRDVHPIIPMQKRIVLLEGLLKRVREYGVLTHDLADEIDQALAATE